MQPKIIPAGVHNDNQIQAVSIIGLSNTRASGNKKSEPNTSTDKVYNNTNHKPLKRILFVSSHKSGDIFIGSASKLYGTPETSGSGFNLNSFINKVYE
jgi:hypothetical protein